MPVVLILICYLINIFAPATLKFPPHLILNEIFLLFKDTSFQNALFQTLYSTFISLFLAIVIGTFLGYLLGYNQTIWNLSQPTIDFFRSIPVTFLIPIATLLLGVSDSRIIWILSTYPCILIIIFSVRGGITLQEPERLHFYKIISGKSNLVSRFLHVTLFETLPHIFSGFRISLSYCLVIVTVLEYLRLGNKLGIGGLVNNELEMQHYPKVYALVFIIGFIGFLLNKSTEYLQHRYFNWSISEPNAA
ncbi:MAG: hypothetical protein IPL65_01160 [Lewinellaceae bacterium]|nr:hypothetical protein [Lewinellaceae bacterium]